MTAEHERHIRNTRLPNARTCYGEDSPVSLAAKMWADRYASDVELLLKEIDRLRAAVDPISIIEPPTREPKK